MVKIKDKKKFAQGIIIMLIIMVILVFIIIGVVSLFAKKEEEHIKLANQIVQEQTPEPTASAIPVVSITAITQVEDWNLKVINKYNQVEDGFQPQLVKYDKNIQFDKRAMPYLKNMVDKMRREGINTVWIQSAYRSYDKQKTLFNNKVEEYKREGKSQEEAEELAQKLVQRAECSEHHLGLAVDFNYVNNAFEDTKEFKWLEEHAQEYGFILRYPKDKEQITGVSYEPWHWRYVGKEHAKKIKEQGICLEEYVYEMTTGVQGV